ncbi:hypothetical protein B0H15DRAFT_958790 [Mycena belliarum]|uniref:Ribonuclease H1 N-terminal domain-containing protein n=1 Tax=Mycena belliarum TaxID=1033014 RepID=A0AAD6TME4_9AGAR|nr:hypothetical protein B0H15DRAFT_958790 [Mycena belliae]
MARQTVDVHAIVELLSPSNPNPLSPDALDALTADLSLADLQAVVELLGLGDLARLSAPLIPRVMAAAQARVASTPAADDDEIDNLIRHLDLTSLEFSLPDPSISQRAPAPAPVPRAQRAAAAAAARSPPTTPSRSTAARVSSVYSVSSPTRSGSTNGWLEAGAATQGVPGASVRTVIRSPKPSKPSPAAYAVYFGHQVGVFQAWSQVQPLIKNFRGAFQCGYPSVEAAERAIVYARSKGWTADSTDLAPPLPIPSSYAPNPLNANSEWFVVSRGLHPGIYSSGLECHLNVVCLKGSLYESFTSLEAAEHAFSAAFIAGELRTLSLFGPVSSTS